MKKEIIEERLEALEKNQIMILERIRGFIKMLNTHEKNFRGIKKTVEQEVIDNQRKRIEYLRGQINNLKYELSGKTKK